MHNVVEKDVKEEAKFNNNSVRNSSNKLRIIVVRSERDGKRSVLCTRQAVVDKVLKDANGGEECEQVEETSE